jgi:hypothetical protein
VRSSPPEAPAPQRNRGPDRLHGTCILEVINTADLAKDKAYEFLFVLGQPRFKGGGQSMINPVAIR